MNKFEGLLKSILNEGIGNVLASTAGGIGTAIKTAENPGSVVQSIKGAIEKGKQEEQKKIGVIDKDNPPQKGQYINMLGNTNVVGKIIDVKNDGLFYVQLIHVSPELENAINSKKNVPVELFSKSETAKKSDFLFVLTDNSPTKWQIVTRDKAKELGKLSNIVIPENFNKFFVLFNSIIEEKRKSKRTRKSRISSRDEDVPNRMDGLPKPPDGMVITTNVGDNTYNAETGEWIMPNGKPNPAPGQLNNRWMNQATQPQEQPQQPEPQPQQPEQKPEVQEQPETGEKKPEDKLLVVNGRGKFTDTEWVGQGTSFPSWVAIPTTNKKASPQQQDQQQQPAQPQQQTQTQPQAQAPTQQQTQAPTTTTQPQTQTR